MGVSRNPGPTHRPAYVPDADAGLLAEGSRVGSDLRAARERIGWTLPAIAAHLRIRLPFLEAIEEGRIADLPGNAYAVGFLRTYAQAMGLDPDEVARRFKTEAGGVSRKTELAFPAPVPQRGIPAGAVVLVGMVIAVGAYIGWYRMSGTGRTQIEAVQPVPDRLAALAPPQPAPTQTAPLPAPPLPPATVASVAPPPPVIAAPPAGFPTPYSASAATAQPAPPPAQPVSGAAAGNAAGPFAGPAAVAPDGARIVLRAKADAWVQVRERQGPVLLNRVLRNGETWSVPASKSPLLLTTGNAGGTELLVDGSVTPALGGDGMVRRDLPLDADQIRDGKIAGSAASGRSAAPVIRSN